MSQFYARYIPPATTNGTASPQSNLKRPLISKSSPPTKKQKLEDANDGTDVLAKYSSTESARKQAGVDGVAIKKKKQPKPSEEHLDQEPKTALLTKKSKDTSKRKANGGVNSQTEGIEEDETQTKHRGVFSRLNKSRVKAQPTSTQVKDVTEVDVEHVTEHKVHPDRAVMMDLGPIPQPRNGETTTKLPLYSTALEWVQNPIRVSEGVQRTFQELGIRKELCENLQAQGKQIGLPVQATVLPLLVDREIDKRNDLCVAAATGSGKTFAYVLPILQSLYKRRRVTLSAVVVVPTRALVKQVLQTFEMCSAGFDIHLGSVEGSKTLEEERMQLVEEKLVYNPDEYQRQKDSPMDWSTFSLQDILNQANEKDLLAKVGYNSEYQSKVDILVATPGRLIEHLQSTKGFNMDHVEWFIADEADRLLNESYHDWLEVVLPALKSQRATERRDKLLEQMRMVVPSRIVTKILLSATMTNDISQLMTLELRNPQLVLMEKLNANSAANNDTGELEMSTSNTEFTLPSRLQEFAVAFKDSENKPLYLLDLLSQHIFKNSSSSQNLALRPAIRNDTPLKNGIHHDTPRPSDRSSDSNSDSQDTSDTDGDNESSSSSSTSSAGGGSSSSSSSDSSTTRNLSPAIKQQRDLSSIPTEHASRSTLPRVLIFTKSTESAHRLARLLSLLSPFLKPSIATLTRSSSSPSNIASKPANRASSSSKTTKAQQRTFRKTLSSFISGQTRILISTDLSSRGLDIPNLEHVVNYDVPASALTYVHRVGRTARAGQTGCAWTLVEHKQGKWFWETIAGKGNVEDGSKRNIGRSEKVARVEVKIDDEWKEKYEDALQRLEEDVEGR